MKPADYIPYPYPSSYPSGLPKAGYTDDSVSPIFRVPWGKDGGNLQPAGEDICESIWDVPQGRRGVK